MNTELIRKETKGCTDKLFFNSAGSSLMPNPVVEKMMRYLQDEEQLGGYATTNLRANEVQEFYDETAKLLNCQAYHIAFMYSATYAFASALSSIPFKSGDYILTTNDDYISNQIAFLALQKRFGIKLIRATNLANGDIDLDHFEELIKLYHPTLVAVTHIPTNSGLIQDVEAIGKLCKKYNCWYLVDACQSIGQLVVDVNKIGCDFLSATGRKFLRGPRGTGFLYVSDRVLQEGLEPLFIDMKGADWIDYNEYKSQPNAKRFEMFELSYVSLIGLKEAIRYANDIGLDKIYTYNQQLIIHLRNSLSTIKGLDLLDKGSAKSSILTFHIDGLSLKELENHLITNKIFYSVSSKPYALIDFTKKNVEWAIRLSPHYFNTLEEIESLKDVLSNINI